jgi:TM2 domain-containing membrane protein YozV
MMKCEYCDNPVPNGVSRCPSCGAPISAAETQKESVVCTQGLHHSSLEQSYSSCIEYVKAPMVMPKNKWIYVLLGIFFGIFGVHNFYAGYIGRGITKLLITILSFGVLFWISWIWSFIEIIVVRIDSRGVPFSSQF